MGRYKVFISLLVFLCAFSSAADVVVNSQDYRDVASVAFYSNLAGDELYYVYPSESLQSAVLHVGPKEVTLIQSEKVPVHASYRSALENNGATITEELTSSDPFKFNLELAELSGTESFILTDPAYPYNLVVLMAYAKASGSYVVFANRENAGEVSNFLSDNLRGDLLVYGTVDREVTESLDSTGIAYDQIENGDKYLDNTELLQMYFSDYSAEKQILFADGGFFEPSITEAKFPVMLISNTIPTQSYTQLLGMVEKGDIHVAVLVKGDFTAAAYDLMKRINSNFEEKKLSVFVKMGQSGASGGEVQPLTVYPLPSVVLDIALKGIQYNTAKEEVELILENKGSIHTYITNSLNIYSNGELIGTVGDDSPQLLAIEETKGFSYPFTIENPGDLAANVTVYFSSSKYNYEKVLKQYVDMGTVDFLDSSTLEVLAATYSPDDDAVSLKYLNSGGEDVYFRTSIEYTSDVSSSTVEDTEVRMLEPGKSTVVRVGGLLITGEELQTLNMSAVTEYGGREEFLVNQMTTPVEVLEPEGLDPMLLLALLALLLIIIIVYFLTRKKKKKAGRK